MPIEKIIVLEDDVIVRKNLEQQLRQRRYDVASAANLATAQEYLAKDNFDLMIADVRLPDGESTDLLRELQSRPQKPLVVMISGFGTVESAVECMRCGAFDYLIKPFTSDQLDVTLRKAESFTQLIKINQYLSNDEHEEAGYQLLGRSPVMEPLRELIRKVARTQATVLIQGESGTGKELIAKALHFNSPRARHPFVAINCAALPENLLETELFGIEKGVATGVDKRIGKFESAHGGTLFLDEIGDLSLTAQAKILRVLQERSVDRVGARTPVPVDVRVIAATNRNLEACMREKDFREDLYYRLSVVHIQTAPLREAPEDILVLANHFLQKHCAAMSIEPKQFTQAAVERLQRYSWPGNARQLENEVKRLLASVRGRMITDEHVVIPSEPAREPTKAENKEENKAEPVKSLFTAVEALERRMIADALKETGGNKQRAAQNLGLSRQGLLKKLKRLGLPSS